MNWRVSGAGPSQIRLDLAANLDVPRFLPLGGVGDSMAAGFVSAATTSAGVVTARGSRSNASAISS